MTRQEYIEEERTRCQLSMDELMASPEPIEELANRIWYITKLSGGYLFSIAEKFRLAEVQSILHKHKYSIKGYSLHGDDLETDYMIDGATYRLCVKDAEAVLPIVGRGKCKIEEKTTASTSRTVVCDLEG